MSRKIALLMLILLLSGCATGSSAPGQDARPSSTPEDLVITADQIPATMTPSSELIHFTVGDQPIESVCLEFDYHNPVYSREDNALMSMVMMDAYPEELVIPIGELLYAANVDLVEEDCQGRLVVELNVAWQATSYGTGSSRRTCHFGHEVQGEFQLFANDDSLNYSFYDSLVWEGPYPELVLDRNCLDSTIDLNGFLVAEFSKAMQTWYVP